MKTLFKVAFLGVFLALSAAVGAAPAKNGGDPVTRDPFGPLQTLKAQGRWEEALDWLDTWKEVLPSQRWWLERARVLAAMGRVNEAADAFEQALKQRQPEAEIWSELKQLRMQQARAAYHDLLAPKKAAQQQVNPQADIAAVRAALERWRSAWSAQDVDSYLALYAPGFRPLSGLSHNAWKAQRRLRLRRPKFIEVRLSDVQIRRLSPALVETTFVQHYRNDHFQDTVRKKLLWRKGPDGHWRIAREEVLK